MIAAPTHPRSPNVTPVGGIPVSPQHGLRLQAWPTTDGEYSLLVTGLIQPSGEYELVPFNYRYDFILNSGAPLVPTYIQVWPLYWGTIVSACVTVLEAPEGGRRGVCYAALSVVTPNNNLTTPVDGVRVVLAADYPTRVTPLAWPGGRVRDMFEKPGLIQTVVYPDPGASVPLQVTINDFQQVVIRSIRATITNAVEPTTLTIANSTGDAIYVAQALFLFRSQTPASWNLALNLPLDNEQNISASGQNAGVALPDIVLLPAYAWTLNAGGGTITDVVAQYEIFSYPVA